MLEGEPEAVEAVVRACREGPRSAVVTEIELSEEEPEGLRGFSAG